MGKNKNQLGRSLTKSRRTLKNDGFMSTHHTTEMDDGYDWARLNLQSVTEESALDDFLHTAELAGTDFTAEKLNVKFVKPASKVGILTQTDLHKIEDAQEKNKDFLSIPRRPEWNESTSSEELRQNETKSFLEWRRKLAELEEVEHITLTPFEKNLEFWRQLWRVLERSDVVVQIVDARNPFLFRCNDLEKYVKEIDERKINMILMNKADLLTTKQRKFWNMYFKSIGIKVVFFSALEELNRTDDDAESNSDESDADYVNQTESLVISNEEETTPDGYELVNTEKLVEIFKSIELQYRYKDNVTTVGLVGYPNVGKSSTINAIFKEKKVSVSATPGKTKHFQTLFVDAELCLCDCPGLVMPTFVSSKAEMILNGILPIDQMRDHIPPMNMLCALIPRHILEATYSMNLPLPREGEDPDRLPYAEEVLNTYGYLRGFMTQRGVPDTSRAARLLLKDYVNGKLLYCLAPPNVPQNEYHTFPDVKSNMKASTLPIPNFNGTNMGKNLDEEFFKETHSKAHSRGKDKIPGFGSTSDSIQQETGAGCPSASSSASNLNSKPWKKHNNRRKKEKLRRIFSHLDN